MEVIVKILGALGIIILLGLVLSLPIWLLWNSCLVPAINGVNEISWLQAWGLNILCTGLFKSGLEYKPK
jgi:hypothetical protein